MPAPTAEAMCCDVTTIPCSASTAVGGDAACAAPPTSTADNSAAAKVNTAPMAIILAGQGFAIVTGDAFVAIGDRGKLVAADDVVDVVERPVAGAQVNLA